MAFMKRRQREVWEPFRDIADLEEDWRRWFGRALLPSALASRMGSEWGLAWPGVDITEEEQRVVVRADLPGMTREEIQVEVEDNTLTLKGERKRESEVKNGQERHLERTHGAFQRSFTLPATVDASKIKATYKAGVLEVALPKRAGTAPKQITIDVD